MRSTHGNRPGTAGPDLEPVQGGGPAVARMVLGARMRNLRESQYVSRQEAAEAIRSTHAHIGDLELGRTGCLLRDISDLLTIYSVDDPSERAVLLELAGQASSTGWWQAYHDVVPHWLETYLGLEQVASVIRTYETQYVPGLLQTPDYARAVIELGAARTGISTAELRRRVELRTRRQAILHGRCPPHVWAVIDEAALRRPVGGPDTMRAQLRHLIEMCHMPHVTLQILPLRAGGLVAGGGPVTLVRLAERGLPDVVYLEQLRSAHYPEDADDVEYYRHLIDRLVTAAEPAMETPTVLGGLLYEHVPEESIASAGSEAGACGAPGRGRPAGA